MTSHKGLNGLASNIKIFKDERFFSDKTTVDHLLM